LWSCFKDIGYTKENPCHPIPNKILIKEINIQFYPEMSDNGNWDIDSKEDLFIEIRNFNREVIYMSDTFYNQSIDESVNLVRDGDSIEILDAFETHNWRLYDHDEIIVQGINFGNETVGQGAVNLYTYHNCHKVYYSTNNQVRIVFKVEYEY